MKGPHLLPAGSLEALLLAAAVLAGTSSGLVARGGGTEPDGRYLSRLASLRGGAVRSSYEDDDGREGTDLPLPVRYRRAAAEGAADGDNSYSPWTGRKRSAAYSPWTGRKRSAEEPVKRDYSPWTGRKRSAPPPDAESAAQEPRPKKFLPWIGKRSEREADFYKRDASSESKRDAASTEHNWDRMRRTEYAWDRMKKSDDGNGFAWDRLKKDQGDNEFAWDRMKKEAYAWDRMKKEAYAWDRMKKAYAWDRMKKAYAWDRMKKGWTAGGSQEEVY